MKKAKSQVNRLRYRKNDYVHNVHVAVQHWILANGGKVALTSGPMLQRWPLEPTSKFSVAISCVGVAPGNRAH